MSRSFTCLAFLPATKAVGSEADWRAFVFRRSALPGADMAPATCRRVTDAFCGRLTPTVLRSTSAVPACRTTRQRRRAGRVFVATTERRGGRSGDLYLGGVYGAVPQIG
jgi:hypothetical protein